MAIELVIQWVVENELPAILEADKDFKYVRGMEASDIGKRFRPIYVLLVARNWPGLLQHRLKLNVVGRQWSDERARYRGQIVRNMNRSIREQRWETTAILEQLAGMSEDARNNWFMQTGLQH